MSDDRSQNVQRFLQLIEKSRRGKLKIYIGMSAGVGKTYRMLQDAHRMLGHGIDIRIAYIETHDRAETVELVQGIPLIPRALSYYRNKQVEEMDLSAVLRLHPEVVIVDELAHTNIPGSKNEKRWQDVFDILDAGINVISAVNIQHIESLHDEVRQISGVDVQERVPDRVLREADEVVNIDLTAEELVSRLKEGKIYKSDVIHQALQNFFRSEHILQLRELALKEVASHVERQVDTEVQRNAGLRHERFMACISTNEKSARSIIRKTARLASYYNSSWIVVYVQRAKESPDRIALDRQRHLLNNLKLATELGAEVIRVKNDNISRAIVEEAVQRNVTTICMGRPMERSGWRFFRPEVLSPTLAKLRSYDIDVIILAP